MYDYKAKLIRVIDGDTVHLNVDLGCDVNINMTCRLYGINAPEMRTEAGPLAKEHLIKLLSEAPDSLILYTIKDKKEKYGRYLAILSTSYYGNVNQCMINHGFAVAYYP